MKRYIFFIGTLKNGGAERVVSILASCMAERGENVEILTYYDRPVAYEMHPNVSIKIVEKMNCNTSKLKNLLWIRKYFKQNAKIVISFLAPFNILALTANLGTGVPIIVADRNDPTKVPANIVVRKVRDFLYRFADGVVVQTEKNKEYFCKQIQNKCKVIYNPVDLKEYAGIALKTPKEKKIVTAGRLMPQKNQKMMIRAFANVLKIHPEYKLVIYGDGPSRNELENLVGELNIKGSVRFPGNVSDLHERMKDAEFFVLSSYYEGMPNALIEAMCMGLPSISTKVSGATDLIEDHTNGLLVENNQQEELEKAMFEMIENKELVSKIGENSVKLNEKLKLSKIIEMWMMLFEENCLGK